MIEELNLEPDALSEILGTGYSRFNWSDKVAGLLKHDKNSVEILAVHSTKEGCGYFRDFVKMLKKEFKTIKVWIVSSRTLDEALDRYGFRDWEERQCVGGEWESLGGKRWDK